MGKSNFVFVVAAICLTTCVYASIRSGLVDTLWRQGNLEATLRLEPAHPQALLRKGQEQDLERLAREYPTRSEALVALGLSAEMKGDLPAARAHLQEAFRRDRSFAPRWAMINFLVRRGEAAEVAKHAQQAAALYEGDLTALFDLSLRAGVTPGQLYKQIVPARPKAQREYAVLLLGRGLYQEAFPAALRLADLARPIDRPLLLDYCDQLVKDAAGPKVAQLWRALPRSSRSQGRCLDWKTRQIDGISMIEVSEATLRFELTGRQPESAVVAQRFVVVEPGRHYHLRALVGGDETVQSAIEWRWDGAVAGTGKRIDLEVAATKAIGELQLVVRRRPGQRSAEGPVEVTNIAIEPKAASLARL